ncbi:MAG: Cof-type HAD-IIB family hydrolase [Roseburia sp.]|nr:Cof-type HAD-IIB family hydrolase [Roseburia sp.]MCM1242395.1 Cof-type HAD-IIB family hydrolase [Roseburia sp.]
MKILFTDLDGTLLNNESMISDRTKQFLDDFTRRGNKIVLSSGRPLLSVLEVKENAHLDYPGILIIASNGTLVYDCDTRTSLLEKRLPFPYVAYLQKQARALGLHIQTYTDDAVVCTKEDAEIRFYRRRIHLPLLLAEDYASFLSKEPFKMLAIHLSDHSKLTDFCDSISEWAADKIQYIFSNDQYLELFVKDAGKGNAVRFVCDCFHVPLTDSYAAGDADNDISMIKAAGCGIAMQNAAPNVKKAADIITSKDNDHDGLAECMQSITSTVRDI